MSLSLRHSGKAVCAKAPLLGFKLLILAMQYIPPLSILIYGAPGPRLQGNNYI